LCSLIDDNYIPCPKWGHSDSAWWRNSDGQFSSPKALQLLEDIRRRFESRKSAAGHDFPAPLAAEEKRALLEYLKTL
jgi:hypothetical protein